MLHEILLSLSGHPSPLLRTDYSAQDASLAGINPSERQLLSSAAHLSDVHVKLITSTAQITDAHPSTICRAVAAGIKSIPLAAFQRKVLDVEASILQENPEYVGAYNNVPLTAIIGEFRPWIRRMEWLWEVVQFMQKKDENDDLCHGATIINRLRDELQSGYQDIVETATSLVAVAETAWLKQVSAWILYGKVPSFGGQDFFIQTSDGAAQEYVLQHQLLPSFVSPAAASSMLFIGKSLNHVGVENSLESGSRGMEHISSQLRQLSSLKLPLEKASFSRTVATIRTSLSERVLQKILPLSKVIEMLQLLRDYFLLGRGEFAMALTHEADEAIRKRWKRADHLAYEKRGDLKGIAVKDGEVAAVLSKTWAFLASMQGRNADEDEDLEFARELLRLRLEKPNDYEPAATIGSELSAETAKLIASSPFNTLLFSVATDLTIHLPTLLDMVITPSDIQIYSRINSYLLSMRRAHIRLTDLWKTTSLRRHHPAIRGADEHAVELRKRWRDRSALMRSSWTTASAAIFFLAETEAYLQNEIVAGLWQGFRIWLTGDQPDDRAVSQQSKDLSRRLQDNSRTDDDDVWMQDSESAEHHQKENPSPKPSSTHDPQTLSIAHSLYLRILTHRLFLTQSSFTTPLHTLLVHIDHLVTHIHRLHSLFDSIDLETDSGVIDAFTDLHAEEAEVKTMLVSAGEKVKRGIEEVIAALTALGNDPEFAAQWEGEGTVGADVEEEMAWQEGKRYIPARAGGVNRLLMKLDFGSWFGRPDDE